MQRVTSDRLGPIYSPAYVAAALKRFEHLVNFEVTHPDAVAGYLAEGAIIARCAGRSEFGPRALGGRSLLASPILSSSKGRLNRIKERQAWRPVAPIVKYETLTQALKGPSESPWMTFSHEILPEHRDKLLALYHPDHSTRAQTHKREQDPWLDALLTSFGEKTGYSILVNTSLNGPGEPIIETPDQALQWFLEHEDVDYLLLDDQLVTRKSTADLLGDKKLVANDKNKLVLSKGSFVVQLDNFATRIVSKDLKEVFLSGHTFSAAQILKKSVEPKELAKLLIHKLLLEVEHDRTTTD
jgi:carbamoyltransferase